MTKYRDQLPQLNDRLFITDGGLETTLIFHQNIDLPLFAAFDLLRDQKGQQILRRYYEDYVQIALDNHVGIVLDTPTWRASADWGSALGYSAEALRAVNMEAVELMTALRDRMESADTPIVISGCVGPRGDGYNPDQLLEPDEAAAYHRDQIDAFRQAGADLVAALTMTHVGEAIGVTRAARSLDMPVVISFTVETDGMLPTGQGLGDAIESVDRETGEAPAYYMINCAHPEHFKDSLEESQWMSRIRGMRCNASTLSHAELDEAEELDDGDPAALGAQYGALCRRFPSIKIVGGCCGTDHRHVESVCRHVLAT